MTFSLRLRIVALVAMTSMLAMATGLWIAERVVFATIERYEQIEIEEACSGLRAGITRLAEGIAFEVGDYARWDDLYQRMPRPDDAWSALNLIPGSNRGSLVGHMALIHDGQVTGRYRNGYQGGPQANGGDPLSPGALLILAGQPAGLHVVEGRIVLSASAPVIPTAADKPARGAILAYRLMDDDLRTRLIPPGWQGTVGISLEHPGLHPNRSDDDGRQRVELVEPAAPGNIGITLQQLGEMVGPLRRRISWSLIGGGLVVTVLTSGLASLLAWRWLRPLHELSRACTQRNQGLAGAIPDGGESPETASLAKELRRLVDGERAMRDALADSLERLRTAHAIHQRFTCAVGQDVSQPLAEIGRALTTAATPQSIAAARAALIRIEGRLADLLSSSQSEPNASTQVIHLPTLLRTIAGRMASRCAASGATIDCTAEDRSVPCDGQAITPALIHLLSNAIAASPGGSTIGLAAGTSGDRSLWITVSDHGRGLEDDHLARIQAAADRGESLPGEPGIGFGLGLVITRTRQLDGRLTIGRNHDRGITVRLELPISEKR